MRLLDLFAGTKSVSKMAEELGMETISLDMQGSHDHVCNILDWDPSLHYPPKTFDIIVAGPPCTHYSRARTNAKTPRDIEGSNAVVRKTLDIIEYLKPRYWFMENPATGLLCVQEVVQGLPFHDVTYCSYGFPYMKKTRIWHAADCVSWKPRPKCTKQCHACTNGKHQQTAQKGPCKGNGSMQSREQLYSYPPELVREILSSCMS
jgi:hypothetical protein